MNDQQGSSNLHSGLLGIPNSSPNHWKFPHKNVRNDWSGDQTLGKGFPTFYKDKIVVEKIGSKTRKHFEEKDSSSMNWRPSIRTNPVLLPPEPIEKPSRVRIVEPEHLSQRSEYQRGKARVKLDPHNTEMIDTITGGIRIVKDLEQNRVADARAMEISMEQLIQKKKHVSNSTNGLTLRNTSSNKSSRDPMKDIGFHLKTTLPKNEMSAFDPRRTPKDLQLLEKQKELRKQVEKEKDIILVKQLDEWMPPAVKQQLEREKLEEQKRLEEQRKKSSSKKKKRPTTRKTSSGKTTLTLKKK